VLVRETLAGLEVAGEALVTYSEVNAGAYTVPVRPGWACRGPLRALPLPTDEPDRCERPSGLSRVTEELESGSVGVDQG